MSKPSSKPLVRQISKPIAMSKPSSKPLVRQISKPIAMSKPSSKPLVRQISKPSSKPLVRQISKPIAMSKPSSKPLIKVISNPNIKKSNKLHAPVCIKNNIIPTKSKQISISKPPLYPKKTNINKPRVSKIEINNEKEMVRLLTPEIYDQKKYKPCEYENIDGKINTKNNNTDILDKDSTILPDTKEFSETTTNNITRTSTTNTTDTTKTTDTTNTTNTTKISPKKRKKIDIIREKSKLSRNNSRGSNILEIRERKVKEKIYVELFRKNAYGSDKI